MYHALDKIIATNNYEVVERLEIPEREPVFSEIPKFLFNSRIGLAVNKVVNNSGKIWRHQAIALNKIESGKNVVISTGTASGKSLIFHSTSFHRALLEKDKRVLVFYPLKALASDQYEVWKRTSMDMDLDEHYVGKIDGSVDYKQRDEILKTSRIVLMTPDVCHAWLMSNLASPLFKQFISSIDLIVLDEAHTLEGVFGSNFALLFRRLLAARNTLKTQNDGDKSLSVIAATATISNPTEHLQILTGLEFEEVGPNEDGSPHYKSECIHLAASTDTEMSVARSLQVDLLKSAKEGGFITFVDSRKGVEILAVTTNRDLEEKDLSTDVLPYRAGFASEDRKNIENRLKTGKLRGVISTSALELGIDLPHLQIGINLGVPATRKSYRQRLGRVGRSGAGAFIVIAESNAFLRYGTNFSQYHAMSVEPSYLYLDNRFMQFAHAKCLIDELESVGAKDRSSLPTRIQWPPGFDDVFNAAKPGGDRPREFDAIAQIGGDTPQRNYPLRNIGEINFKLIMGASGLDLGEVTLSQALREAYPGATYYHMARPYKVQKWVTTSFQPAIDVKSREFAQSTKPRIRTWISAGITHADLLDGHYMNGDKGFMAECQMQITEKVEGYKEGESPYVPYSERRISNPNMRSRTRQFRTTGVILCIEGDWFSRGANKSFVAERMKDIFVREYSILPQDIGMAATNIAVTSLEGNKARSDCIAIFDETYGSLRLTEKFYLNFDKMVDRMRSAAETEQVDEKEYQLDAVDRVENFYNSLEAESQLEQFTQAKTYEDQDYIQVFGAGSKLGYRESGVLYSDIEIIMPTILNDTLMYQVKCPPKRAGQSPVKKWIDEKYIEPLADDGEWGYATWDPVTQEYVDEEDES